MSLTLLKGLMPHVPALLPLVVSDPEMRMRAEETFMSPEFQDNIEEYFVANIKVSPGDIYRGNDELYISSVAYKLSMVVMHGQGNIALRKLQLLRGKPPTISVRLDLLKCVKIFLSSKTQISVSRFTA